MSFARSWRTHASYAVRLVLPCPVCKTHAPVDHTCEVLAHLIDHPGTDDLIADLRKPAAAADTATAETTPTT